MSPSEDQSKELRRVLSGAAPTIADARETVEWLASAPVATVMTAMGGSAAFLIAHATGAFNPVLIASSLLGMSIGAFLSRYVGPAAIRRRREEIELRRDAAAAIIATWKALPPRAPADVAKQLGSQITNTMTLPDLSLDRLMMVRRGRSSVALPPPDSEGSIE